MTILTGSMLARIKSAVAPDVNVRTLSAGADQGSVEATFNNDGITVASGDLVYYTYSGATYIYGGPTGDPVTTATAGDFASQGAAPVQSVNTQTGAVVLDADDIDDAATTHKFVTAADVSKLGNLAADASTAYATAAQGTLADSALQPDQTAGISVGYSYTVGDLGTVASGTVTPDEADGTLQTVTNDGTITLAPPVNNASVLLHVVNGANVAAAVATSGWTLVDGDPFTDVAGDEFLAFVVKSGSTSHLMVRDLSGPAASGGSSTAAGTTYDNSASGLAATDVKAALDELDARTGATLVAIIADADTTDQAVRDATSYVAADAGAETQFTAAIETDGARTLYLAGELTSTSAPQVNPSTAGDLVVIDAAPGTTLDALDLDAGTGTGPVVISPRLTITTLTDTGGRAVNPLESSTTTAGGGERVSNLVKITRTAYDALGSYDADTVYLIDEGA